MLKGTATYLSRIQIQIPKLMKTIWQFYYIDKFWLVRLVGNKEYTKEMKIADSIEMSLLATSNEMCNTGHAP